MTTNLHSSGTIEFILYNNSVGKNHAWIINQVKNRFNETVTKQEIIDYITRLG